MNRLVAVVTAAALGTSGCSFIFQRGVPGDYDPATDNAPPDCSTGNAWPVIDTIIAGLGLLTLAAAAGGNDPNRGAVMASGGFDAVVGTVAAAYGFSASSSCRAARESYYNRGSRAAGVQATLELERDELATEFGGRRRGDEYCFSYRPTGGPITALCRPHPEECERGHADVTSRPEDFNEVTPCTARRKARPPAPGSGFFCATATSDATAGLCGRTAAACATREAKLASEAGDTTPCTPAAVASCFDVTVTATAKQVESCHPTVVMCKTQRLKLTAKPDIYSGVTACGDRR